MLFARPVTTSVKTVSLLLQLKVPVTAVLDESFNETALSTAVVFIDFENVNLISVTVLTSCALFTGNTVDITGDVTVEEDAIVLNVPENADARAFPSVSVAPVPTEMV